MLVNISGECSLQPQQCLVTGVGMSVRRLCHTLPRTFDAILLYAIVLKLQTQVQNIEQELIKLKAKFKECHCPNGASVVNRQMHAADLVTQTNN